MNRPNPAVPALWRYRAAVLSRLLAATLGGYALLVAADFALARLLWRTGMSRPDAVMGATIGGFILLALAALWSFGTRSGWRAWIGVLATAAVLALLALALGAEARA